MDKSVSDFNVRLRTIKIRELVVFLILSLIISLILMTIFPILYVNEDLFFIMLLSVVVLFFIWALKGTTGLNTNFEKLFLPNTRNEILYVFAINMIFAFIFTCLIGWLDLFIGFGDPNWVSVFDIDSVNISPGVFFVSSITSIIFAPLLEELIFRGILFNRLKIRIGIVPAMILSSFIFGIGHDFGGMTSAFLFGMCMCILYLKTDNILVPMSVHFINNLVATVLKLTPIDAIVGQIPWLIPATLIVLLATLLLVKYILEETIELKNRFS